MKTIIENIKAAYELNLEYYSFTFNGQDCKIRMNKDHSRNSFRNDDQNIHNLSLVNCVSPESNIFRNSGTQNYPVFQYQFDKCVSWIECEEKIYEFLYEISEYYEED